MSQAMIINVLYFADLREQLELEQEKISLQDIEPCTVEGLVTYLQSQSLAKRNIFLKFAGKLRFACNGEYCKADKLLQAHDEIAIFPPITGG